MNLHRWLKEPWDYVLTATRITQHAEVKSDGMKSIMSLQKKNLILTEGRTLSVTKASWQAKTELRFHLTLH